MLFVVSVCFWFGFVCWLLFCCSQVMNGDVMRETYQMILVNERRWWMQAMSQLFMYSFVFAFIYVGTRTRTSVGACLVMLSHVSPCTHSVVLDRACFLLEQYAVLS